MLDTYLSPITRLTADVQVVERKAPTAESASLLKELQEEARRQVISSFSCGEGNAVEGNFYIIQDHAESKEIAIVKFILNGRPYKY